MEAVNDSNERETYLHGGSFVQIDWDMLGGLHRALGSVSVQDLATRQVIPQPGGDWLEELDWYFIVQPMTREKVKRVYRRETADFFSCFFFQRRKIATHAAARSRMPRAATG